MHLSPAAQQALLDLARRTIRGALSEQAVPLAEVRDLPELLEPAGCFVSLHELHTHLLRGCVGSFDAKALHLTVMESALGVLQDPRFHNERVTLEQLRLLEIEISLLSPLQPLTSVSQLDPLNEGVHLSLERRSACFLPQVARQTGWTREQLLCQLCVEKLQAEPYDWQLPQARLSKFTTFIIGPEPFEPAIAPCR
jgi:AmmeMemoRadiSam system protein A